MKCWRHSVSVCCGRQATRIFLLEGKTILAYCDECADEMTGLWNNRGWMNNYPESKERRSLEWEELPVDMMALFDVQDS